MLGVERPCDGEGMTRVFDGGFSAKAASAALVPTATIWPPPLTFAGTRPASTIAVEAAQVGADDGRHSSVGLGSGGHRSPAHADEGSGLGVGEHARDGGRGEFPHGVPRGGARPRVDRTPFVAEHPRGEQGGGNDEGLGDGGVLDLLRAGGGAKSDEIGARGLGELPEEVTCAVELQPFIEHAGGLRPLSWAKQCNHNIYLSAVEGESAQTDRTNLARLVCRVPTIPGGIVTCVAGVTGNCSFQQAARRRSRSVTRTLRGRRWGPSP